MLSCPKVMDFVFYLLQFAKQVIKLTSNYQLQKIVLYPPLKVKPVHR
jgi:hypothetical protein